MISALNDGDPRQVGKYRLLGTLGSGGMGQVFLGESPGGRRVAVKLIRAELAGDPGFRARFAREVATARTVSGIFTAPVVDADLDASQPWLVTAYVEGPSLAEAVQDQGPLPVADVRSLTAGLAEGLGAIHAAGVVHRDLKPSNVLLAGDGPRIIDFGISHAADATLLTQLGWVSGSPGFMSPEQAEGQEIGPLSDIFSLGAVLVFAATGTEPFGTGTAATLLYRVVHTRPATDGVPRPLRSLVEHCMSKDPRHRPTTDQILAGLGPPQIGANRIPAQPAWTPTEPARRPGEPGIGSPAGAVTSTAPPRSPGEPLATVPRSRQTAAAPRRSGGRRSRLARVAVMAAAALAVIAVVVVLHRAAPPAVARAGARVPRAASPGWRTYRYPGLFSVRLPNTWAATATKTDEVDFTGAPARFTVVIAWTSQPQPDALTDWQQQAAARAEHDPNYRQIGIRRVFYRGYNAADWEFTDGAGEQTHVLDRSFIVTPGHLAYAIELYGPASQWDSVFASMWNRLVNGFALAR